MPPVCVTPGGPCPAPARAAPPRARPASPSEVRRGRQRVLQRSMEQHKVEDKPERSVRPVVVSHTACYRILTARAANRARISNEISAWSIVNSLAHRARIGVSVGDKAVLVVKARNR